MDRSRGGLSSKLHAAVDGTGMPLVIVLTGGQRNDGAMLGEVLADIRVPRLGPGRPRTTPDAVVADKAYSNGIIRRMLAARGIRTVIPQKTDELASRGRKGSAGGRPPRLDRGVYQVAGSLDDGQLIFELANPLPRGEEVDGVRTRGPFLHTGIQVPDASIDRECLGRCLSPRKSKRPIRPVEDGY